MFGLLGLGLSLGSKKEARSAAFGLSIGVIFVYYVIIRLGEQAGDTGLMARADRDVGGQRRAGRGGADPALSSTTGRRPSTLSTRAHYSALLPRIRTRNGVPAAGGARERTGSRPRARGRVIVLRVPRLSLPIPGLLDRYIARTYVGKYALVLTAFWALFVLVSFMDLFDDVQQNKVKGIVVFHYYAFFTPSIAHLLTPVAVLVAVLITFGVMARYNEITAMKAAGLSIYRIVFPALALVRADLLRDVRGGGVPAAAPEQAGQPRHERHQGPPAPVQQHQRASLDPGQRRPHLQLRLPPARRCDGRRADVPLRPLRLRRGSRHLAAPGPALRRARGLERRGLQPRARLALDLPAAPAPSASSRRRGRARSSGPTYFAREERASETMSFGELRAHIATLEQLGLDVTKLRVELHRKIAYPMVSLIMTLIAIPFAFVVARRGALYGVATSVVIAIVYWAMLGIFEALGQQRAPARRCWRPGPRTSCSGRPALYFLFTLET